MKNIIIPIFALISSLSYAQIIIGDNIGSTTKKTSVLLEFSRAQKKGLILPYVRAYPITPMEGTIILDATTPTAAKVKFYNGNWIDLSVDGGNVTTYLAQQPDTSNEESRVVIAGNGSATATATAEGGVLVLESTRKAMVLPIVNSTSEIINPAPGMIVYVSNATTSEKLLAVFDGNTWSFLAAAQ